MFKQQAGHEYLEALLVDIHEFNMTYKLGHNSVERVTFWF